VLVDSGSVGTFVSTQLVQQLNLDTVACDSSSFRTTDGGLMVCDKKVQQLKWFIQGYSFVADAKVLPLKCYDLILGEDWLEEFSPMTVDYKLKTIQFAHQGQIIKLQGVVDNTATCTPLSVHKLSGLLKTGAVSHCIQMKVLAISAISDTESGTLHTTSEEALPAGVSEVLGQFAHLFAEPTRLPPSRTIDHKISLVPGAQPVKVRPYKYSPI
jgi:hypothetical protein